MTTRTEVLVKHPGGSLAQIAFGNFNDNQNRSPSENGRDVTDGLRAPGVSMTTRTKVLVKLEWKAPLVIAPDLFQ